MPCIGEIVARPPHYALFAVVDVAKSDDERRCELCNRKLRWVHILKDVLGSRTKEVGCCCARRLAIYDAEAEEATAKNRADRLERFLDQARWKLSRRGYPMRYLGPMKKRKRQPHVTIVPSRNGSWTFFLREEHGGWYPTMKEAQIAAFEMWERMR